MLHAYGAFIFRCRNLVFPLVMAVLLVLFPPRLPLGDADADRWTDAVGTAAVVLGLALRFLVSGLAEIRLGGLQKRVYAERLHTDGVFAHGRNPLYVANLAIVLGLFVILNNPWTWLLGGAFFVFSYCAIIATEERYLRERFGIAYAEYSRRVPRWLIHPRGLLRSISSMRFDWARAIVKEYSPLASNGLALLAVLAWDAVAQHGLYASRPALLACFVLGTTLVVLCAAARRYKKSRRYRSRAAG